MSDVKVSSREQASITAGLGQFPFRAELSLAPLVRYWEQEVACGCSVLGDVAATVLDQVRKAPALTAPVVDPVALRAHEDVLRALMLAVISPTFQEEGYAAALLPFRLQTFFATPAFTRDLTDAGGVLKGRVQADASLLADVRIMHTYSLILHRLYGMDIGVEYPWISIVTDPETGLDRHFKLLLDRRFLEVEVVGEAPVLTEETRRRLRSLVGDPAGLMKLLPPEKFVIRGFSVVRAIEVTEQEVLSSIERDLIDKESIVSPARFRELQAKLRSLLRRPEVELGVAAVEGDRVLILNFGARLEHSCIFADSTHYRLSDFAGSIYERASMERRPVIVEDLEALPNRTRVEEGMLAAGYRSVIVAPLIYQDAIIGSLKLVSPTPGSLSMAFAPHLLQIHPLYALADIRGSSTHRAWAIQADLLAQLGLARDVLAAAHRARPMPILDQLRHRVDTHADAVELHLRTGDEAVLVGFLRTEIESLFDHLQSYGSEVRDRIEAYRAAIDPQLGAVGAKRRAFDESVTLLNEGISTYLDAEERAAQAVCPHYFEKQRTDGVDYSIYAGASLLEDNGFTPLHLKNLRLWQLMVACGIAVQAERLKPRMPEPLDITSLILVQQAPLAIRFRFDEKRFDVDGAYNVRYEIMKKRIDKAVVMGTTERVTQPGKLAIVYSQAAEAAEYRDYIAYLQAQGYLHGEVEKLELEELQGVSGLRALRVAVNLGNERVAGSGTVIDLAAGRR